MITDLALVLFCKRPQLGYSKQRLAKDVGGGNALKIAQALLECALEDLLSWTGNRVVAVSDQKDVEWMVKKIDDPSVLIISQGDGNMGERLDRVDEKIGQTFNVGRLYIGSDAPLLMPGDFERAADALRANDVVLATSDDGGVTIMGCQNSWPTLAALPWSTERLAQSLAEACAMQNLSVAKFSGGSDIDTLSDLERQLSRIGQDARPSRRFLAAVCSEVLS